MVDVENWQSVYKTGPKLFGDFGAKWVVLKILFPWILVFGSIQLFFITIIGVDKALVAALYFMLVCLGVFAFYKDIFEDVAENTNKSMYVLILFLLMGHALVYVLCTNYLKRPIDFVTYNPVSFLLVNRFFLLAIPLNVLSQQLLLIVLFYKLHKANVSFRGAIFIALLLFSSVHLFQAYRLTPPFAVYFVLFSIVGAIAFPYIFYKVKNGYLFNTIVHLAFYDLSALLFFSLYTYLSY